MSSSPRVNCSKSLVVVVVLLLLSTVQGFLLHGPPPSKSASLTQSPRPALLGEPIAPRGIDFSARQSSLRLNTRLHGLFGLGVPELVVIAIAAAFILGPQKLAELGKDAGKIAGELKEVPKEFQKGLAEGEMAAKQMKAAEVVMEKEPEKAPEAVDAEKE
jgi:sec-independent protein translocase protein TatA